ncbi:MAG: GNAT family N-acetyltransferase [Saprospiraceae bacterium]|nr:GNAT family N-acetyltransferase [Saprospiraceae bacterium]
MTSLYQFRYSTQQDLALLLPLTLALSDALGEWGSPSENSDGNEDQLTAMDHLEFNATCPFYRYYLCAKDNELVGFVWFGQSDNDRSEGFVDGLYVKPDHRHRGIAAMLMKEALSWIRNVDCHSVILLVNPQNSSAIRLYEKIGFTRKNGLADTYAIRFT